MQPKGAKSENVQDFTDKRTKSGKKLSFCVKFELFRGGARLYFIAKRLGSRVGQKNRKS